MGKINWNRVLLGSLVWWLVFHVIGAAGWFLMLRDEWTSALAALGRTFTPTPAFIALYLALSFVAGVASLWLYAAIRPRYGAGPKTAIVAGSAVWLIGRLLPTLAWAHLLAFPARLVAADGVAMLVAFVVCTMAGARLYTEA